jgi:hypothetical protein
MIRPRAVSNWANVALGSTLLILTGVACDEDGKTVPAKCVEEADQPIFDISTAGAPADYSDIPPHDNPCITNTGHAISPDPNAGGPPPGRGGADSGGAPGSDAGAGGA